MLFVVVVGMLSAQVAVPQDWSCDREFFGDGVCDCGCTSDDIDCTSDLAADCDRDNCGDLEPRDGDPKACGEEPEEVDGESAGCPGGSLALVFPLLLRRRRR
ncbi:MAG: hypothetical protein Q8O67_12110 [Deltaproteobacteria bacterium]|nr:hypothetical protein [Deltaproteobacteria bacterium]